jgi:stage II sporulation protein AA (anti-sigma F factor antagonist)
VEITTASHGLAIVLAATGRLDAETVTRFEARLFDLIAEGHRRIILDLAGLGYINSAGLRVLLVAAKRLKAGGGRLLLAAPGDLVGRVLEVSGFSGMLETCATTEEALARVAHV